MFRLREGRVRPPSRYLFVRSNVWKLAQLKSRSPLVQIKVLGGFRLLRRLSPLKPSRLSQLRQLQRLSQKESPSEASREQIEGAVATIQDFVQSVQRSINFALDDSSGRVVVKVTDSGSGDVIRQIPSEEALQMAEFVRGAEFVVQSRGLIFWHGF